MLFLMVFICVGLKDDLCRS